MGSPQTEQRGAYFLSGRKRASEYPDFTMQPCENSLEPFIPVKVVDAVYLRGGVHREGDPVQAAVTNHTRETARMISLPHGPQDTIQDGLGAL